MGTVIKLQVTGVDYRDDDIIDEIHFNVPQMHISVRNSLIVGIVEIDDPDLIVDKVLRCDDQLKEVSAGASISRVYLDLVGIADISKRCGVSRQAVRKWTENNPFPSPAGLLDANDQKTWLWADVCDWLEDVKGVSFDDTRASAEVRAAVEVALKRKRRVEKSAPQKNVHRNS